jgi:hypothetical protein
MTHRARSLLLLSLSLCLTACDDDRSSPVDREAVVSAPADDESAAAGPTAIAAPTDWRAWVDGEVDRLQKDDPTTFDALMKLAPAPTRAGTLRFRGDLVRNASAAPIFLHRLTTAHDDATTRAALVEALSRTGVDVGGALADLLALESDATVREVIVETSWRAPSDSAIEALRRGLRDAEPSVRAASVRAAARHVKGSELASELLVALGDADAQTRVEAVRTLGVLQIDAAKTPIAALLSDADAEVRLASVRALGRIDATWAAGLPAIKAMDSDEDPVVVRAVEEISAPR